MVTENSVVNEPRGLYSVSSDVTLTQNKQQQKV